MCDLLECLPVVCIWVFTAVLTGEVVFAARYLVSQLSEVLRAKHKEFLVTSPLQLGGWEGGDGGGGSESVKKGHVRERVKDKRVR